jgi:glutathione S-transferase
MSSDNRIVFHDIASDAPARTFAPNPWKTRYALNLKGLDYTTKWIDMPDIPKLREELGVKATRTLPDGKPFHTLPILKDGDIVIGDTFEIAVYLDNAYSDAPKLFRPNTIGLTAAFNAQIDTLFTPFSALCSKMPFREPEPALDVFVKRLGVSCWDDLQLSEEQKKAIWVTMENGLGELAKAYSHMGGTTDHFLRPSGTAKEQAQKAGRREAGPFLDGDGPAYADFIVGAWLKMLQMSMEPDDWERVRGMQDGLWGRVVDALERWAEIK